MSLHPRKIHAVLHQIANHLDDRLLAELALGISYLEIETGSETPRWQIKDSPVVTRDDTAVIIASVDLEANQPIPSGFLALMQSEISIFELAQIARKGIVGYADRWYSPSVFRGFESELESLAGFNDDSPLFRLRN